MPTRKFTWGRSALISFAITDCMADTIRACQLPETEAKVMLDKIAARAATAINKADKRLLELAKDKLLKEKI